MSSTPTGDRYFTLTESAAELVERDPDYARELGNALAVVADATGRADLVMVVEGRTLNPSPVVTEFRSGRRTVTVYRAGTADRWEPPRRPEL